MITRDNIRRVIEHVYAGWGITVERPEELDTFVTDIVNNIGPARLAQATGVRCCLNEDRTGLVIELVEPRAPMVGE